MNCLLLCFALKMCFTLKSNGSYENKKNGRKKKMYVFKCMCRIMNEQKLLTVMRTHMESSKNGNHVKIEAQQWPATMFYIELSINKH